MTAGRIGTAGRRCARLPQAARRRRANVAGLAQVLGLLVAFLPWGSGAMAEVVPLSYGGDPRIREVVFDPEQVIRLDGVAGYHLHLVFEEGESFVNLGAGDAAAIEVGAEGRHLMLKPKQEAIATNLTLVTTKRVYTIEYSARAGVEAKPAVYVVRFRYPEAAVAPPAEPQRKAVTRNREYWACGAPELRPVGVFDDGVQTHLRFGSRGEWPAIFVANADGSEGLVNFHVEGDVAVVHRVARRLVLRRGERVACVENRAFAGSGQRLPTGTVADDVERVTNGGGQ